MPLNIDWQQILLHLLNFVILFAILYFLLYKPVRNFMRKREEHYKKMDDEANEKLKNAEEAKEKYESILNNADSEAAEKIKSADAEISKYREERTKQADEEAEKIIAEAVKKAESEKQRILGEVEAELPALVSSAMKKLDSGDSFDSFLNSAEGENADE